MTTDYKDDQTFKTDQTPLAAHLLTEGHKLLDVIFNGKIATFIFPNDDPQLQELVREFELMRAPSSDAYGLIANYQQLIKRIRKGY
jgi:hypothetical protein